MSDVSARASLPRSRPLNAARDWLGRHDPGYAALRRAARAAILMPALFAVGDRVIKNPTMSYFLAFGSFAMLLMVDFSGSRLDRLRSQTLLGCSCALLICIGTLVSQSTVLAVTGMFVVAFTVLFSGVVSSIIASATTPLLLSFILPVTVPGPASQIPERAAGWGLAAAVSLFAITFLWPSAVAYPVESRAVGACRAIANRIRADIAWIQDGGDAAHQRNESARIEAERKVAELERVFLASPYRPTGLSSRARAEIRLVDELRWLDRVVLRSCLSARTASPNESVCVLKAAAADALELGADAMAAGRSRFDTAQLRAARQRLRGTLTALIQQTIRVTLPAATGKSMPEAESISALDPSFRAQELAYVTDQIISNVEYAVAAGGRSWFDRLAGRWPQGLAGPVTSARERALSHAALDSSWFHNSLRGATGLALAVLVADLTSVEHGFWVVFGTLAVLRSNALSTGQNVMRGLFGTSAGFIIGGAIVAIIGTNTTVLWLVLPFVVLFAGLAPAAISFAAGQAAFTMSLLVLFNILVPVGWSLGLLRIEDVAIGSAVSLVVGILFWPRGAAADLGRALERAYTDSSRYLQQAVEYGIASCETTGGSMPPPRAVGQQAAASSRRLDDTFRGYLTERGGKPVPLADVTTLVTGVAGLRLAADAVLDLWDSDGDGDTSPVAQDSDRAPARQELLEAAERLNSWFSGFASSLNREAEVPDPLPKDTTASERLVAAVADRLRADDGQGTATGVRVIWTGDHLDAVRRLQPTLVEPARAALTSG
jgi:Fusaric acid resistance protein-like